MKKKLLSIVIALLLLFVTGCSVVQNNGNQDKSQQNGVESYSSAQNDTTNNSATQNTSNNANNSANQSSSINQNTSQGTSTQNSQSTLTNSATNSNQQNSTNNSTGSSSTVIPGGNVPTNVSTEIYTSGAVNPTEYDVNAEYTGNSVSNLGASVFNLAGYGAQTTGGGNISESSSDYYKVTNADEFIRAISRKSYTDKNDTAFPTRPAVIEIMNDIDLGWNNIGATVQAYSDIIKGNDAQTSPALKQSGISTVYLTARQNLTIFSRNASEIKHACFQIRGDTALGACKNIIIRNVIFRGPWEWDDSGKYDANDWDIITIRADKNTVEDIWIDHCTFYKPYDGTIDIKYAATDITISWCTFLPHDTSDSDFKSMMDELENNRSKYPNYNSVRNAGATVNDMIEYAMINKKTHLIGHTDNNPGDDNIRVTYCNNFYYDCTERLPRLRMGKAHVYNCVFDASRANALKVSLKQRNISFPSALSFASNGSLGTNYGKLLLENCYISGINTPLRNNNKKAGAMYDGCCEMLYSYYTCVNIDRSCDYSSNSVIFSGCYAFLGNSTKTDGNLASPFPTTPLAFNTDAFKSELGYEYTLYRPFDLGQVLSGNVGANKLNLTADGWKATTYASNYSLTNKVNVNGVKGSTANLGASRA